MENLTPTVGEYFVEVDAPGMMAERIKLNFKSQPQTLRLKRGRTLAGRVVEAGTGHPIPNAEVRAVDFETFKLPALTTRTDANGRFEFTSLGNARYRFFVSDGQVAENQEFPANGDTNLTLSVKLYDWSKLKPKAPPAPDQSAVRSMQSAETASTSRPAVHLLKDSKDQPVEITSESGNFDAATGILTTSNRVVLKHSDILLQADFATVNRESGDVNASGNVVYQRGTNTSKGSSIRYNSKTGEATLDHSIR
ncbi:MAG: carboxypeptidase regulatory-like domain-containing protein [Akkermansiaceae bacterium]|nr:carboxypeptidase regulatory-like domain-containing protein [Verrucomicrobiales bacterium]